MLFNQRNKFYDLFISEDGYTELLNEYNKWDDDETKKRIETYFKFRSDTMEPICRFYRMLFRETFSYKGIGGDYIIGMRLLSLVSLLSLLVFTGLENMTNFKREITPFKLTQSLYFISPLISSIDISPNLTSVEFLKQTDQSVPLLETVDFIEELKNMITYLSHVNIIPSDDCNLISVLCDMVNVSRNLVRCKFGCDRLYFNFVNQELIPFIKKCLNLKI